MLNLIPDTVGFVFINGCSDLPSYKRRREIYIGVDVRQVKQIAKDMGLVGRAMNTGDKALYTEAGLDLQERGQHMKPYVSYAYKSTTSCASNVMEIWYAPEPCTDAEADNYYLSKTSLECKV